MSSPQKDKINALVTAIIIFISVLCVGVVYAPRVLGYDAYVVETGSMAPTISKGSMAYVKKYSTFEDYALYDIVTFTDYSGNNFTHRIIDINEKKKTFTTKGDANESADPSPANGSSAVGKVEFAIPLLGYVAKLLKQTAVKIAVAVIYIAWIAIEIEVFLSERKRRYE